MKKKCRRKHWPLLDPIRMAIEGAAITADDKLDRLRILELSAIESFARGHGTRDDWRALADLLNVSETMARGGVGPEVLEVCQLAEDGLSEARERFERTGRMGLSGPAIQAMRDLAEYHQLQRTAISRGEYERWITKTANRIRSAHPSLQVTV